MNVKMNIFKRLLEFVKERDKRFLKENLPSDGNAVQILARTVKLGEEVGELNNDILRYLGLSREDKLASFKIKDLEEEFVDVLITLLVLASRIKELDLEAAIERKMKKIRQRDQLV